MGNSCSCVSQSNTSTIHEDLEVIQIEDNKSREMLESDGQLVIQTFIDIYPPGSDLARIAENKLGPFQFNEKDGLPKELTPPVRIDNGSVYIGQFNQEGKKCGRGIFLWPDGSKYIGYWQDNQANGLGRLVHADGDVYEGEWKEDKANGKGKYVHFNGATYEGDWFDDKQQGYGVEKWTDGALYKGNYKEGLKHGYGEFFWSDGSQYKGNFEYNNIHGNGEYIWSDGKKYKGEWKDNKMHGQGQFYWTDGRYYKGSYAFDKKDGYGEFVWPSGKKYQGQWKNGMQHGAGTYVDPFGNSRDGEWYNGKKLKWHDNQYIKMSFDLGSLGDLLGERVDTPFLKQCQRIQERSKVVSTAASPPLTRQSLFKAKQEENFYQYQNFPKDAQKAIFQMQFRATMRQSRYQKKSETPTPYARYSCISNYTQQKWQDPYKLINHGQVFQERVRNELLLKRKHYVLRSLKKEHQQNVKVKEQLHADNHFFRLINNLRTLEPDFPKIDGWNSYGANVLQSNKAYVALNNGNAQTWLGKHGRLDSKSKIVSICVKRLFKMVLTEGRDFLMGQQILQILMELQAAPQPLIIDRMLKIVFNKPLAKIKVKIDSFVQLFQAGGLQDRVFGNLLYHIYQERSKKFGTSKISEAVEPQEYNQILRRWWKEFKQNNSKVIPLDEIVTNIIALKFFNDRTESINFIIQQIGQKNYIDFEYFYQIFLRSILKGLVLYFFKNLDNGKQNNLSDNFNLNIYRKNRILAGMNQAQQGYTLKDGKKYIKAVRKAHKYIQDDYQDLNYYDFSNIWEEFLYCSQKYIRGSHSPVKLTQNTIRENMLLADYQEKTSHMRNRSM